MSTERPDDRATRFGRGELPEDGVRADELDQAVRLGRELEDLSLRTSVRPSPEFTDRVMAAIEAEPVPAPVIAAGSALRAGAVGGLLAAIRDAFRVTFGGGFPMAARAQALTLVLVVVIAAGGTGIVAARAVGLLDDRGTPPPSPTPSLPSPSPMPSPSLSTPAPSPVPSTSTGPTASPEPSGTPDASETPRPTGTDDHGGGPGGGSGPGGGGSGGGSGTGGGGSDGGSGTASGSSGPGGGGDDGATATDDGGGRRTPRPTETPKPTGDDHSGPG